MSKGIIWFINKETAPSYEYSTHMRTNRQAQYFQDKGYEVKVFCSAVVHNSDIVHEFKGISKEEIHDGVPMVFVKCNRYGESFVKRILSYIVFSINMLRYKTQNPPDIIVHESKTPFDMLILRLKKRYKAKYIVDIEDLWPDDIEQCGILKHNNPLLKIMYALERVIYKKADHVCFSFEGAADYIKFKKWDKEHGGPIDLKKIHYVNNGISLEEFNYNKENFVYEIGEQKNNDVFRVVYLGSIRLANNLDQLISAAKVLREQKGIRFFIWGNGDEREALEKRCKEEDIDNVVFKEKWIDLKYVPYVLDNSELQILNYGQNWGKYGGSMNKMFMAFASGKPVICNAGMLYSDITRNNLGIDQLFADANEYAQAILSIYNMGKEEYDAMCERVKEVSKLYDTKYLCDRFAEYCEIS